MHMTFYQSREATILFKWWTTSTYLNYSLSCVFLAIVGIVNSVFRFLRDTRKTVDALGEYEVWRGKEQDNVYPMTPIVTNQSLGRHFARTMSTPAFNKTDVEKSLLHKESGHLEMFLEETCSYLDETIPFAVLAFTINLIDFSLMLAAMCFNFGVVVSICLGYAVGAAAVRRTTLITQDDPVCCS